MKATPVSISSSARRYPRLPYQSIKDAILGPGYELSLVFVGPDRARAINESTRNKSYVPNVLSFPLDAAHGEIYLTPHVARREAKQRGQSERGYTGFLFVHGCLHLKGLDHGRRMEALEVKYCADFELR